MKKTFEQYQKEKGILNPYLEEDRILSKLLSFPPVFIYINNKPVRSSRLQIDKLPKEEQIFWLLQKDELKRQWDEEEEEYYRGCNCDFFK